MGSLSPQQAACIYPSMGSALAVPPVWEGDPGSTLNSAVAATTTSNMWQPGIRYCCGEQGPVNLGTCSIALVAAGPLWQG